MLGSDDWIIDSVVVNRGDCAKAATDSAKLITIAEQIPRKLITISPNTARNAASYVRPRAPRPELRLPQPTRSVTVSGSAALVADFVLPLRQSSMRCITT